MHTEVCCTCKPPLRPRSIPAPVAKQLLVSGFLNEVVDRLDHPAITGHIHDLIEAKFARR